MNRMLTIFAHPLVAASMALALALAWAFSYTMAEDQARVAAKKIKPWAVLARAQMTDVGACEDRGRFAARSSRPGDADTAARDIKARLTAYDCASAYLLSQPLASPPVAAQVLGYAAAAAEFNAALGVAFELPSNYETLYAKTAKDARLATKQAEQADATLLAACDGLLSSTACSIAQLTPDRPDRRLGDSMRDFEIDVHAQHLIALYPKDEIAHRSGSSLSAQDTRPSPAYTQARRVVLALP